MDSVHPTLLATFLALLGIGCNEPAAANPVADACRDEARPGDCTAHKDDTRAKRISRGSIWRWFWVQDDHDDRDANDDGENDEDDEE